MESHPKAPNVQFMACGAITNLARNHPNKQRAIASNGGLELVIAAMRQYELENGSTSEYTLQQLQGAAIGSLWSLVKAHPENQATVIRLGASELILRALQRAPGDQHLRSLAKGVMEILVPGLADAIASGEGSRP